MLDVSANRIGQRGARALALALKRSPTLASVNVGRNDLGADACAALLKAGAQSAGLFELRGARAAGARAADVAAFARRAADRLGVTRRAAGGGGRTPRRPQRARPRRARPAPRRGRRSARRP